MKIGKISIITGCLCFFLISCADSALENSLKLSGDNRAELERVLLHYKDNSEKKKAAEFLIRNMPGRYSLQSPFLFRYYELLDSLQGLDYIGHDEMIAFYDFIYQKPEWRSLKPVYDIESINSQYLITHIDAAFDAWKSPWARDLTFEEFCDFLFVIPCSQIRVPFITCSYKPLQTGLFIFGMNRFDGQNDYIN